MEGSTGLVAGFTLDIVESFKKATSGKLAFGNGDELGGIAVANALISKKKTEDLKCSKNLWKLSAQCHC